MIKLLQSRNWYFSMTLMLIIGLLAACGGETEEPEETEESEETTEVDSNQTKETEENTEENSEVETSSSDDVANFYDGATIDFIVPYGPSGGYGQIAIMMSDYLEEYTGASVNIRNIEGAGGMMGSNELYESPNDGLTVGILNGVGLGLNDIANVEGATFEYDGYSWIGRVNEASPVLTLSVDSEYSSVEDLLNADEMITLGATGLGGSSYADLVITGLALDIDIDIIHGYDTSAEVEQGILRGEVDGMMASWGSRRSFADQAPAVMQTSSVYPDISDVPTWDEYVETEFGKELIDEYGNVLALGRGFAAPPGVEQEKIEFLREAFDNVIEDPGFIEKMEEAGHDIEYLSGEDYEDVVERALNMPEDITEIVIAAMEGDV